MYSAETVPMERSDVRPVVLAVMVGFCLVNIGRIQEVFSFLVPLKVGKIFFALSFLILLDRMAGGGMKGLIGREKEVRSYLAFIALGLLLIPFSFWSQRSLEHFIDIFLVSIVFFLLLLHSAGTRKEIDILVWGFLASVLLLAVPSLFMLGTMRLASLDKTYDPNDIALLMVVALPFIVYALPHQRGVRKFLLAATLPILLLSFLKAGSRGGMVGLIMVIAVMLLRRGGGFRMAGKAVLVLFIAGFLVYAAPEVFKTRVSTLADLSGDYNLTDPFGRIQIWERALKLTARYPFTGVGPGCFGVASGEIFADEVGGRAWRVTAHNSFLLVSAEMGIGGLGLFTALFVFAFRGLRKLRRQLEGAGGDARDLALTNALETSLVGFLVCGFFLSQAYHSIPYFLMGLAVAHRRETAARYSLVPEDDSA